MFIAFFTDFVKFVVHSSSTASCISNRSLLCKFRSDNLQTCYTCSNRKAHRLGAANIVKTYLQDCIHVCTSIWRYRMQLTIAAAKTQQKGRRNSYNGHRRFSFILYFKLNWNVQTLVFHLHNKIDVPEGVGKLIETTIPRVLTTHFGYFNASLCEYLGLKLATQLKLR